MAFLQAFINSSIEMRHGSLKTSFYSNFEVALRKTSKKVP